VQPGRHGEVGAGRLEHAARMIVEQQVAALRHAGKGEHGIDRATRHHPRVDDPPVRILAGDERHLAPLGGVDLGPQQRPHGRR